MLTPQQQMEQITSLRGLVGKLVRRSDRMEAQHRDLIRAIEDQPSSVSEEIDSIKGRRIWYTLGDRQTFDISQAGLRAAPLTFLVSQDGAFICTHYPLVIWKPSLPTAAANFGAWRPVSTWPLPDQVLDTDLIDLSYEVSDGGNQREFQNEAVGPIFSRPDNLIPLPIPTLFSPNSVINFFPTYERISFGGDPATTQGTLYVGFPGYRIVNL